MKKFATTFLISILFLVLTCLICFKMAIDVPQANIFVAEASDELPKSAVKSLLLKNEYFMSESEFNSYLQYLAENTEKRTYDKDYYLLTNIYFDFQSDVPSKCYLKFRNSQRDMVVSVDVDIRKNGNSIDLTFSNLFIGKLHLPEFISKYYFQTTDFGDFSKYINADEMKAEIPTHYSLDIPDFGEVVSVDIIEISVTDSGVSITTNEIVKDSLSGIASSIVDNISEFLN